MPRQIAQNKRHGGEGGIRTPDTRQGMAAFEAARFNRSRTSPRHGLDNLTRPLSRTSCQTEPLTPGS